MGRPLRTAPGDLVYHVLNRANGRVALFEKDGDYAAFEQVLAEACDRVPMRILAYCVMPNHWHLVLWPSGAGELSRFIGWITLTHTQRWHAHHHTVGHGHLYQGRFKSFLVQQDAHLLTVCRYVERNALRAGLVERAEQWRWGSCGQRQAGDGVVPLGGWPVDRLADWVRWVNEPEPAGDLTAVRRSVTKGQPFGSVAGWTRWWRDGTCSRRSACEGGRRKRGNWPKMVPDTFSGLNGVGWYEEGYHGRNGEGPHVHVDLREGRTPQNPAQWGYDKNGTYGRIPPYTPPKTPSSPGPSPNTRSGPSNRTGGRK